MADERAIKLGLKNGSGAGSSHGKCQFGLLFFTPFMTL